MDIFSVIALLGGLALFLYGIELMGDGLKNASGAALKRVLEKVTHNTLLGVLTGVLVTAVIQSSTATTVLTVGLVSAGIMNLRQAVSIIMGANIGTTVTAQIIRLMDIDAGGNMLLTFFKPANLGPVAAIVGIILVMFIKGKKAKCSGEIFMGFGVLFIGLINMTAAVSPLSESQIFADVLTKFSSVPILGILTGLVTTAIVQSSSAMVGIVQALSSTGLMTFSQVYPVIMGINLGTCITTAIIVSIGSSKDARRIGIVHILFNAIGTVLMMILMSLLRRTGLLDAMWNDIVYSGDIANFHTVFNLLTTVLLLPFTNQLVKAACLIVRDKKGETEEEFSEVKALDDKLFVSPAVALEQARLSIGRMGALAQRNLSRSLGLFNAYDPETAERIAINEDKLDEFTDAAENFLLRLSHHVATEADDAELNLLLQAVTDFERIGDYASKLTEISQRIKEEKILISESAMAEFSIARQAVEEITSLTVEALQKDDLDLALRVEPLEEVIDEVVGALKSKHIDRLKGGNCTVGAGILFTEALTNISRASDQCSSIAVFLLGRRNPQILANHHAYLNEIHKGEDPTYAAEFARKKEQYLLPLSQI